MKQRLAFCGRHPMATAYALALALWVLYALFCAGWDALGFATGRLHTQTLALADVPVQGIALSGDVRVTTDGDPQLLLDPDQAVRSVIFATDAPASGFEGYYGSPGQDPSLRRRVWADETPDGQVRLVFPLGGGSVRIDPAGGEGVVLGGADITLTVNAPLPLWLYFVPIGDQGPALVLLPAVFAALWDLAAWWSARLRRRSF